MYAAQLLSFCQALGIEPGTVAKAETRDRYLLEHQLSQGALERLQTSDLVAVMRVFGPSLRLFIGLGQTPLIRIEPTEVSTKPLDQAVARGKGRSAQGRLDLRLGIDKATLLEGFDLPSQDTNLLMYLFARNFRTALAAPLPDVERTLFPQADRTVVVVSDLASAFTGSCLSIIGLDGQGSLLADPPQIETATAEQLARYRQAREQSLLWQGISLARLTPLHMCCDAAAAGEESIPSNLEDHLFELALLYTANRSARIQEDDAKAEHGSGWECVYASAQATATLRLNDGDRLDVPRDALAQFARWPYASDIGDRLSVLRTVVARAIQGDEADANTRRLIDGLEHILNDAAWHHQVLLEGEVGQHLARYQKVADYIADTTQSISDALGALAKGLTETLIATIAYLVATILAALLEKEISVKTLRTALWVYVGYLGLVAFGYRLGSALHSYLLLNKEADARLEGEAWLLEKLMEPLEKALRRRRVQFWVWFAVTALILLGLIGALAWGAANLEQVLTGFGIATATPTP
jgi:hypothetical protein